MSETKGISVSIQVELHRLVKIEQEAMELTMSQYMTKVIEEHFNRKEGKQMSEKTRTLAFQVSEELFQRIKEYLAKKPKLSQREFVIGLIEKELEAMEIAETAEESRNANQ